VSAVGRKLFWWLFLPLAIIAGIIFSLPFLLRNIDYSGVVVWQLETQLNRKVELSKALVEFFPHVRIALQGVTIRERDGVAPFLSADRLFVDVRIFPLLVRKVVLKRLRLDRPQLVIRRDTDGRLNVADLFASAPDGGFTIPILGDEIIIADGQIIFEDAFQTDTVRSLTLKSLNTRFRSSTREINIKLSTVVPHEKGQSMVSLTAKAPRQPDSSGALRERGEGRLEAKSLNLAQLGPFLEKRSFPEGLHGIVDLATAFEYHWAKEEDSLTLKDLRLTVGGTAVTGSAMFKGILATPGGFIASLTTSPFQLESLVNGLSDKFLHAHSLQVLKDNDVKGQIRLISLRITGEPAREHPFSFQGDIEVLGGQALIGTPRVPLSDVRGRLRIDEDRVVIEGLMGKYGTADVTAGRGEITKLTETMELYLAARGKVSAQELGAIIERFAPRAVLPEGVKGLNDLVGAADATVLLSGSLRHPESFRVEWELEPHEMGFSDPRLRLPITHLTGKVRSLTRGVAFEQLTGALGQSALLLNGGIKVASNDRTSYDLDISVRGEAIDLWRLAALSPSDGMGVDGPTAIKLNLSGPVDQLRAAGVLDLTQASLMMARGWGKPRGIPGRLEFNVGLDPGGRATLTRGVLEIPPLNVLATGNVMLENPRRYSLTVRVPSVSLRGLPKELLGSTITPNAGSFQGEAVVAGPLDNWQAAKIKGRVAVKGVGFAMEKLEHPVEDLTMDLVFDNDRIQIERGSVKVEDSQITATGTIGRWRGTPMIDVNLSSPRMDLELLIPKGERSPVRIALEALIQNATVMGTVMIHKGRYKEIALENLQAQLTGGDGMLVVDSLSGRADIGTLAGQIRLALSPGKPLGIESAIKLDSVPIEEFVRAFGMKASPVSGSLSLQGNLRGESGTVSNLNGEVRMAIQKGHFQKLSATSKIIGILNLPSLLAGKVDFSSKGMPFDCISGQAVFQNGVAKVQKYIVDSPIMKMTGAGTYDLANNNIKMIMAVSPLGSYEDFLKDIPLFGKLFEGDRQGFVTAFFEVRGPLEDPRVTLLPIKSVASGMGGIAELALDLMKNVFFLPKELLLPSKKTVAPCSPF
jgi:hypothetical protein